MSCLGKRWAEEMADCGRSCCVTQGTIDEVAEALERARVVGVLDAWAATNDEHYWVSGPQYFGKSHYCTLWDAGKDERVAGPFPAETPDAARAAAAKAIELGEV